MTNSPLKSLPLRLCPRLPYLHSSRESKPQGLSWIQRMFGSQLAPVTGEGSVWLLLLHDTQLMAKPPGMEAALLGVTGLYKLEAKLEWISYKSCGLLASFPSADLDHGWSLDWWRWWWGGVSSCVKVGGSASELWNSCPVAYQLVFNPLTSDLETLSTEKNENSWPLHLALETCPLDPYLHAVCRATFLSPPHSCFKQILINSPWSNQWE